MTFRPEFEPPWIGWPYVTALIINRLAQRDIEAMIDRVVGNKFIPASVRQDIIERTDGIPLFVEEMTKSVLEAGSEAEAQRTAATVPSTPLAVPASLHASLMARLDRLGPAKEVAQIGAAIGREFSHALLAPVVRKPEADLNSALNHLISAGLVFRQGVPPHATYLFKHALVQDAAYGTLLREPRRALHARIAETLESHFADIAESQPEHLARHCTEAGMIEKAAGLWGKAGQRSLARSALAEAAEQLNRALAQLATLPATPLLRREQIKLQVALITPLMHVKGYAASETKAATEQARLLMELAEKLGEPLEDPFLLFSVLYGVWLANFVAFNGDVVRELARQFMTLAGKQRTIVPLMIGHRLMGTSLLFTGDVPEARAHYNKSITLYNPTEHRPQAARLGQEFGQDSQVATLTYRSLAAWVLGYPTAAVADIERALENARAIGHAASLIFALIITSTTRINCADYTATKAQLDEAVGLAGEKGASFWKVAGTVFQGCLSSLTGKAVDAVQIITSGIAALHSTGGWVFFRSSYCI